MFMGNKNLYTFMKLYKLLKLQACSLVLLLTANEKLIMIFLITFFSTILCKRVKAKKKFLQKKTDF